LAKYTEEELKGFEEEVDYFLSLPEDFRTQLTKNIYEAFTERIMKALRENEK
jgi:hypothetical protein